MADTLLLNCLSSAIQTQTVKLKRVVKLAMKASKEIVEPYDIEVEQIGSDKDHVHICFVRHTRIAPGQIVKVFKSIISLELIKKKSDLKRDLRNGESSWGMVIMLQL